MQIQSASASLKEPCTKTNGVPLSCMSCWVHVGCRRLGIGCVRVHIECMLGAGHSLAVVQGKHATPFRYQWSPIAQKGCLPMVTDGTTQRAAHWALLLTQTQDPPNRTIKRRAGHGGGVLPKKAKQRGGFNTSPSLQPAPPPLCW